MRSVMTLRFALALSLFLSARAAAAQDSAPPATTGCQSLDDAWWTGPMLAAGAGSLPRGHFLIEPYLYDVHAGHTNSYGSLSYVLYGVANRVTVGMIPTFGFNAMRDGTSSSGVGVGDIAALAQFRLTQFHEGGRMPTTSLVVQETFPTGAYDRLGSRPSDGFGSGAYTTTVSLYAQTYFWLHNGRILRMRADASQSFSNPVNVSDVSVYGTGEGFRGHATPGSSFYIDGSWEYSVTRSWVLALDLTYRHAGATHVTGYDSLDPNASPSLPDIRLRSGASDSFGFAPGIEYSWKPSIGVLLAARVIPAGYNTTASITPAIAINIVR